MLNNQQLENLKSEYPVGSRVVLIRMDDPQAPPIGTHGTVIYVDAIGTVHVRWDNGSGLGVAYGEDKVKKEREGEENVAAEVLSQHKAQERIPRRGEREQ